MSDFTTLFTIKNKWDFVLAFTYDINPISFFESELLPHIFVKKNMTLALDESNYRRLISDSSFKPYYLGTHYNLEPVRIKKGGAFHPKLFLFLSDQEALIYIGSPNITSSGFKANLEVLFRVHIAFDALDQKTALLAGDIIRFLKQFTKSNSTLISPISPPFHYTIEQIVNNSKLAAVSKQIPLANDDINRIRLLSSADGSLLGQLQTLFKNNIAEIHILSPFYDSDLAALKTICNIIPKVSVFIPSKDSTFPVEVASKDWQPSKRLQFYSVSKNDVRERFIHAKYYRITSHKGHWDFISSANFTLPGFISDDYPRNLEVGILFPSSNNEIFADMEVSINRIKRWSNIILSQKIKEPCEPIPDLAILAAYFNDSKIYIMLSNNFLSHSTEPLSNYLIELAIDRKILSRQALAGAEGNYFIESPFDFDGDQIIQIQLIRPDGNKEGAPVFVNRKNHNPSYQPPLGASAFLKCQRIGGIEGLRKAFELAEQSGRKDWLFHLLAHWKLERILLGVDTISGGQLLDGDLDIIPSLPTLNPKNLSSGLLKHNLFSLLSRYDDFRTNLESFLRGMDSLRLSAADLGKSYVHFCFPIFIELACYFADLLAREELKKKRNPLIAYPEYTWLSNFNVYKSYFYIIFPHINALFAVLKSRQDSHDDVLQLFLDNSSRWLNSHTALTFNRLQVKNSKFTTYLSAIQALVSTNGLPPVC